jgi:tetratricopeptide (TPR) repeat protein
MKAKLFVIGLFLFALAACTQRAKVPEPVEGPSEELSAIDSLMWRQPDSALVCLLPYFDTCSDGMSNNSTPYDKHYANLLLAELLYKNDYPQTNRMELLQAVNYFDSLCLCKNVARNVSTVAFLDARAHYINGVGYYENDSVVEACQEYMKALEIMESYYEEKELAGSEAQFMAYTYTRLTGLFSDLYLHEQTIFFAKNSLTYFKKVAIPSWNIARILNEIGSQYDMMELSDSATFYYRKAMVALDDTTLLIYRDIAAHLICLEYKKGICQADTVVGKLHQLLLNSESERESQARYLNIGETFYHEQKYDSAWVYLNKVFQTTSVVGLKRQAAEWLVEIGKAKGIEVHAYTDFLVPFANQEENKSEIKSQLTELYKVFGQAQQERHHQEEMRRHRNQSIAVVVGLSFVILIVLSLYHNSKRHKQQLKLQIDEEKHAHNIEKKALSSRLKKSNETLRGLQDQIKQHGKSSITKAESQAATFMEEPICRLIMKRVHEGQFKSQMNYTLYKDYALSKEQLVALREATNQHFDHFIVRLVQAHPEITNSDLDYCCLHLLGLTDADISALMQRAYNTVNERNSKLRKILGCKNSISVALLAFANGGSLS